MNIEKNKRIYTSYQFRKKNTKSPHLHKNNKFKEENEKQTIILKRNLNVKYREDFFFI